MVLIWIIEENCKLFKTNVWKRRFLIAKAKLSSRNNLSMSFQTHFSCYSQLTMSFNKGLIVVVRFSTINHDLFHFK